ncbi:hypothetical protein NL676_019323 [Syzygium grande]|nr:hypothetical protein NL676_019323 [Syzygium grande]
MLSPTQNVLAMAFGQSLGSSKLAAPGLASSAAKTSALKVTASAEKIRVVAHGVIASAEKTSLSAMRTAFCEIMRKQRIKPIGFLPWATFGCSVATCTSLLVYGDGIECAAESLPAAPSIASLVLKVYGYSAVKVILLYLNYALGQEKMALEEEEEEEEEEEGRGGDGGVLESWKSKKRELW